MSFQQRQLVVVVDFGGQQAQLIARRIRALHVYSEVWPHNTAWERYQAVKPQALIVCGSTHGGEQLDSRVLELGIPVLEVSTAGLNPEDLKNFLFQVAGCRGDWSMTNFIDEAVAEIKAQVGDATVICGLSGGIDSAVAAVLVHKAVGKQLTSIFVDQGLMRQGEAEEVVEVFGRQMQMQLVAVDARKRFLDALAGVADPEQKRKIIGTEFIRVFEAEARRLGDAAYLVQGTIYPDVIESGVGSALVKSHHNVGGLPEDLAFKLIEPLRELFKDEVREIAALLGLPDSIVHRQPFPGPGLGVRCLGEITAEKLAILRHADAIVTEEIKQAGLYRSIWQAFAVLPNVQTVGVSGERRTYAHLIAIRAVNSVDAMSAEWTHLPYELLERMAQRIVAEVDGVNRVVYDITAKPPGTIEWE
ncbi:MAG TPA: GMP synthase (glutamine-hydrolyzing) [Firmicutes bacterium]|nr:GMP synthase (glutamine-hydrolyzing) [Bacillota bacterium]